MGKCVCVTMKEVRKCHANCDPKPIKKRKMAPILKVGDKVRVNDPGLILLQQFAPPGAKPNNEGTISQILEDGYVEVEFPIGDDDPKTHSQAAVYPARVCKKIS